MDNLRARVAAAARAASQAVPLIADFLKRKAPEDAIEAGAIGGEMVATPRRDF